MFSGAKATEARIRNNGKGTIRKPTNNQQSFIKTGGSREEKRKISHDAVPI